MSPESRKHYGKRLAVEFTKTDRCEFEGFPRVRSDPTATAGAADTREVDVASPREILSLHVIDQSSGESGRSRMPGVDSAY
jgi:hypothetical protein